MGSHSDLQATQQIIQLFERAKAQNESALDSLPGVFAVIDAEGKILKGNENLATLFSISHEALLGRKLSELFSPQNWSTFNANIQSLLVDSSGNFEFEMDVKDQNNWSFNYTWNLNRQKIKVNEELKLFTVLGRDVTEFKNLTEQKARMEVELSTAKTVQDTLFPPTIADFGNSQIAGYYEPASECGGDWWYYCQVGTKLYLWIGDVTGHGVPAALVTSAVRSAVSIIEGMEITPAKALSLLSRAIFDTAKGHKLMTFFIASVDLETGDCKYARAGHEPSFVLPQRSDLTHNDFECLLGDVSSPLGIDRNIIFKEYETKLVRGDRIFFYTDGLYDVKNAAGRAWGQSTFVRRLAKVAKANVDAVGIVGDMLNEVHQYRKGTMLDDDVTFFVFKF